MFCNIHITLMHRILISSRGFSLSTHLNQYHSNHLKSLSMHIVLLESAVASCPHLCLTGHLCCSQLLLKVTFRFLARLRTTSRTSVRVISPLRSSCAAWRMSSSRARCAAELFSPTSLPCTAAACQLSPLLHTNLRHAILGRAELLCVCTQMYTHQ